MKVIEWLGDRVRILDQTRLPREEVYLELSRYQDIASAITELKIRGAPAIGVAGSICGGFRRPENQSCS
jgi:methylthioribose-1-phosphate isomerase